jgi:hypothetical protein
MAWDTQHSNDRVPDRALGASAATLRSMRWAMASWPRIARLNRWFGGTLAPRFELDWIPGIRCAAHFAIVADRAPASVDDYVTAGAAMQRFWLTATMSGLQLQPQYTPLVFAAYARCGVAFTVVASALRRAGLVRRMLDALLGDAAQRTVFLGRLGYGPAAVSRSTRLPLERLRWTGELPSTAPPSPASP